jgi:hypothetical protein
MTLISRISSAIFFLAILLPIVSAHNGGSNNDNHDGNNGHDSPSNGCGKNEFLFGVKNVCVPIGGPPTRPKPPKGSDCPPTKWYWGEKEGCCVPEQPPKPEEPEPQCRGGWKWLHGEHRCCEDDQPKPPTPHPSGKPDNDHPHCDFCEGNDGDDGNGHNGNGHKYNKRNMKSRTVSLCPAGLEACPIASLSADYECLDTNYELESCGGCVALGKGQDCTAIKGAWNVGCEQGVCRVYTCASGYRRSADGKSCIAN